MGGSSGGGGGTTTTVNKTDPPDEVKPFLSPYVQRGFALSEKPFEQYGGQRIASMTPEQNLGLGFTTQRAMQGSPLMRETQNQSMQTARGDFLRPESNPYLRQNVQTAMGDVQSRVNSQFNRPGAFGGSAHQELLTRNLSDTAAQMYGANFANERTNQQRAMAFAPQLAETDYRDAQALLGVGDVYRENSQDLLNMAFEDFLTRQQYPYQQVNYAGDVLARSMGGGGTSTSTGPNPFRSNRAAGALGGAAAGAGLGSMLALSNPATAGLAIGGGLLGLF
jgi:hypothetical protein